MKDRDIDSLVERSFTVASRRGCWRTRLQGEPAEFMAALEAAMRTKGRPPNMTEVQAVLVELGVNIGVTSVRDHLAGRCACAR